MQIFHPYTLLMENKISNLPITISRRPIFDVFQLIACLEIPDFIAHYIELKKLEMKNREQRRIDLTLDEHKWLARETSEEINVIQDYDYISWAAGPRSSNRQLSLAVGFEC